MTMRRRIDARSATQEPHKVWNAFVDLIATEEFSQLSPLQRKAHLVFWYESEVQNGGHGQYFENQGAGHLGETIEALGDLGLQCQATVLRRAQDSLAAAADPADWAKGLPGELLAQLDDAFHRCAPDVPSALENHLQAYKAEYIEIA